jgi:hypothetical protein
MAGKHGLRVVVVSITFFGSTSLCRGDFESQLLQKFQSQNQGAAAKLKSEITGRLAQAATFRTSRPEHALELIRKNLERLEGDSLLQRDERAGFIRECQERVRDLKDLIAQMEKEKEKEREKEKEALARERTAKPVDPLAGAWTSKSYPTMSSKEDAELLRRRGVGQAFANVQVTPVVSADRRFVRIGLSGTFVTPGLGPVVPIQGVVPSVFPGPGPGVFTVGQPYGLFQLFLPQLTLAGTGLGTTVVVPSGGSRVIAGYSSLVEGRFESGTPVLGKIPYLGRMFRNVGFGRSSQVTEISVSPQIIILR